ncbi:MAG: cell division protein FtsX [Gammaproteobacteria bacterium SG8_31]|jgi:lipoprotein-releasing system permease protein|nr:MAG: cell division protein FtsX [Gammaproteobacteria bacterium SG8_31]
MFRPLEIFVGLRYLRARRLSRFVSFISLMSLLGVAVGVAALIVVISVMNGFENELRQRLLAMTSHASISGPEGRLEDWSRTVDLAQKAPGVTAAAPYVEIQGMLGNGARLKAALVRGVDPIREPAVSQVDDNMLMGSLDSLEDGKKGIILGRLLAAQLGVAVGESVTLMVPRIQSGGLVPRLRRFTVTGIFEVGMQELDGVLALVNLRDAAGVLDLGDAVTGVRLQLENLFSAPAVSRRVAEMLGSDFVARDWTEENASYFRAVRIEKTMMTIILSLVVAVAAFNIVATLVMVVTDKRSEIAILRTLGLSAGGVMRAFLVQGVLIGLVGIALGVLLGIPLALNVETIAGGLERALGLEIMPSDVYYIARLPSDLRGPDVVRILALAFFLCAGSTLYPAYRAARTQPAEALRYDH